MPGMIGPADHDSTVRPCRLLDLVARWPSQSMIHGLSSGHQKVRFAEEIVPEFRQDPSRPYPTCASKTALRLVARQDVSIYDVHAGRSISRDRRCELDKASGCRKIRGLAIDEDILDRNSIGVRFRQNKGPVARIVILDHLVVRV